MIGAILPDDHECTFFSNQTREGDENNHFQTKGVHAGSTGVTAIAKQKIKICAR